MSLKRHPALQPFSRDHLIGLFHAQRLIKLAQNTSKSALSTVVEEFAAAWRREISVHFADEDRILAPLPLTHLSLQKLQEDHDEITKLVEKLLQPPHSQPLAVRVGQLLDAHIRWEEHELFPEVETTLTMPALELLGEKTGALENARHRSLT